MLVTAVSFGEGSRRFLPVVLNAVGLCVVGRGSVLVAALLEEEQASARVGSPASARALE